MKTVYIELIFLDNFIIDLIILLTMMRVTERRVCIWRCGLGAAFGGIYAMLCVIFYRLNSPVFKIAASCVMVLIARGFLSMRSFIVNIACFYGFTLLSAGSILLIQYLTNTQLSGSYINLPLIRYLTIGIILAILITEIIFRRKQLASEHIYLITAKFGKTSITLNAVLDTGNSVFDNCGNGVIIASLTHVLCQLDINDACRLILPNGRHFTCVTAAGKSELKAILPDSIIIRDNNKSYHVKGYIALSENIGYRDYNALLPNNMRLI